MGNWQRGGDKKARKPAPIQRPGVTRAGERRFGGTRRFTIAEMDRIRKQRG